MTAQLAPVPIAKFWDNNGFPLALGTLTTYIAGTTTPLATYVDSTQTTQNTNPIQLNFRGECNLWLDPTKSYKFLLQDLFGNTVPGWPVDNITIGNANPSYNIVPTVDNLYTLGSPTFSWANIYVGANHAPILDTVSGNIGYYARTAAEIAAGVTPTNYAYAPGVVDRYGTNTTPGTTDMAAAVRLALDCVPAIGGIIQFQPNSVYLIGSVVFIPQRRNGTTGEGGIIIEGNNCTIVGPGLGAGATGSGVYTTSPPGGNLSTSSVPTAIFETGTGTFSTVAKGGATNFGLGNELSTTLHDNDKIRNINFKSFGMALHLFNFVLGCELENLYFVSGYTAVMDDRSFYSHWKNINASFQQSGSGATGYPIFNLNDTINDRAFIACHAVGANAGAMIGWQVNNGVQGCGWFGCSAEQCGTGFNNQGTILGAVWEGGYFENNSVAAISLSSGGIVTMDIVGNDFISTSTGAQPVSVVANNWISGRFSRSNNFSPITASDNVLNLSSSGNSCLVEIPVQIFTESQSLATAAQVPTGYSIGGAVQLDARRTVYVSAAGAQSEMISEQITNTGPPLFAYSGGPVQEGFETGNWLPFCTQTNTLGQSTFLTQITWSTERMVILFDLIATSGATVQLSGIIFAGGASTLRSDANATYTVTPSSSSGKLLLTVAGSGMSGKTVTWRGQIRHV